MVDWTPDPTKTQLADDGSGRRREWAFRDVSPGAPKVQPQPRPVPQPQRPHPQRAAAPTVVVGADIDLEPVDPAESAFGRAQAASAKRFSKSIDLASADLGAGRWTWPAIILFLALCGWSGYSAGVTFGWWGRSVEYPQTQPNNSARPERESGSRRAGGGSGVGTNHCRELLIEWFRTGQIGSMTDDEIAAARRAVEADR